MRGVITGRDVLENLGVVWREFGPRCVGRCLLAWVTGRHTTFLALALTSDDENGRRLVHREED